MNTVIDGFQQHHQEHHGHGRNHCYSSNVCKPSGENFVFERNNISAAHVQDLDLHDSEFADNKINGCYFSDAKLISARLNESTFAHSHVHDLELDHSEIIGLDVKACHVRNLILREESEIEGKFIWDLFL